MSKFDWYQGTFHDCEPGQIVGFLERAADLADLKPCAAKNGYEQAIEISRMEKTIVRVMWGGNPGVHVIGTGDSSPWVAEQMRLLGVHQVTRVDAAEDFISPGMFDLISSELLKYATKNDIVINQQGDWERGKARTLYLGAPSSVTRLVIYEKGYESGGDLNWVRFEARARPKGKQAREAVSRWSPDQIFSASVWLKGALDFIGWNTMQVQSIGTVWKPSDTARARRSLLRQYGAILSNWAEETSWNGLGSAMARELESMRLESAIADGEKCASEDYLRHLAVDTAVDTVVDTVVDN
jgi:hypothetical protein